jgi:hypothetical protein
MTVHLARSISEPIVIPENEEEDESYFEATTFDLSSMVNKVEQIIERYILRWGEEDKTWEILEVEKRFEIPIPDTDYLLSACGT